MAFIIGCLVAVAFLVFLGDLGKGIALAILAGLIVFSVHKVRSSDFGGQPFVYSQVR